MSIEKDREALLALGPFDKTQVYINWSDGGGGEVIRHWDMFFLFEVPQFGGEARFSGSYHVNQVEELLKKAHSWT